MDKWNSSFGSPAAKGANPGTPNPTHSLNMSASELPNLVSFERFIPQCVCFAGVPLKHAPHPHSYHPHHPKKHNPFGFSYPPPVLPYRASPTHPSSLDPPPPHLSSLPIATSSLSPHKLHLYPLNYHLRILPPSRPSRSWCLAPTSPVNPPPTCS